MTVARHGVEPRAALIVMAVALAVVALTGGFSRYDTPGLMILRPVLVIAAAALAMLPAGDRAAGRVPLILLGLLAAVIGLQLVPLPPALWLSLPGRAPYAQAAAIAGTTQPWRPVSIVPVLTLNALLALLPAAVFLIGYGRLSGAQRRLAVPALAGLAVISATLGILQVSTGADSWAYLYAKVSAGLPDGLFANRNHQAAFLAGSLPFFVVWAIEDTRRGARPTWLRIGSAGAGASIVMLVILGSGSRSGLVLAGLNVLGSVYLVLSAGVFAASRRALWTAAGLLGGGVAVTLVAVSFGRGSGFARFLSIAEPGAEMRFAAWPVLRRLAVDYLPLGSGFGTFNPLFRMHEPDALLKPTYFNAAHNDLLELVITGGIPAVAVLMAFVGWFAWRCQAVFTTGPMVSSAILPARAAAMFVATFLLASLSDYPLRTPLAGALVALAVAMVDHGARAADARRRSRSTV